MPRPSAAERSDGSRTAAATNDYARERRLIAPKAEAREFFRDPRSGSEWCAPKLAKGENRKQPARAQRNFPDPASTSRWPCRFTLPAKGARIGQTELIKDAPNNGIDDVVYTFRIAIERRDGRKDDRSRFE